VKPYISTSLIKLISTSAAISLLFLLGVSCSHNEIFFEYHSFQEDGWNRENAAVYHINIDNTTDLFDVSLEIRNNNDYLFRNIWLFVDFQTPGGNVRTDTIGVELADVYGKWYGKGISLYSLTIPYETAVRFPQQGTYTYSVRQGMRENPLTGISDIGLKILKKID
jgi:gliding motility-associated lipoprotein GldH